MKSHFHNLILPLILLGLVLSARASEPSSVTYTEGTLYYTVQGDSATITGCFGHDAEVHVPAIIAGTPVNTIAAGAFTENEYVRTLYLPDTITKVERGAIGDWIKVIYNANTDHPQETPTELILRNRDPEPETAAAPETSQPEETAPEAETTPAAEPSAEETSAVAASVVTSAVPERTEAVGPSQEASEPASTSAESESTAPAAQTSEAAVETPVAAEETSKPAETSAPSAETVPAASSAEQLPEDLTSRTPQLIIVVLGIAAAAGAAAAVTVLITARKKK